MKFTLKTKYDILTVVGMQAGFATGRLQGKDYTIYFHTITGQEVQRGEFETLEEAQKEMNNIYDVYSIFMKTERASEILINLETN